MINGSSTYRRVPLSDTPNFRDLGGYPTRDGKITRFGVFFRSACPNSINDADIKLLKSCNITTAVDLRGGSNKDELQKGYADIEGIATYNFPLGEGEAPKFAVDCPQSYLGLAENRNVANVIKILADCDGAAVFHCFAGKDRTGVIAAILLMTANVDDVDIIADYTLTYAYFLKRLRMDFLRDDAEPDVFKPLPDHMEGFLKLFRQKYGNVNDYLLKLGVTQLQLQRIKEKFVI